MRETETETETKREVSLVGPLDIENVDIDLGN
jgi:hypothetical protein